MKQSTSKLFRIPNPASELRRRKREIILIPCILAAVGLLTWLETHLIQFGADIPISNTILMFILLNINLLLLLLLIFLVFRNLVKFLYDRRRRSIGANLRTRLVITFVALTLLPTTVLFVFSINFISASLEFWFNAPVEKALQGALDISQHRYTRLAQDSETLVRQIAEQVMADDLLSRPDNRDRQNYLRDLQVRYDLAALEIHTPASRHALFGQAPRHEEKGLGLIRFDQQPFAAHPGSVGTVIDTAASGELIRAFATLPAGMDSRRAEAFIVLAQRIPSTLTADRRAVQKNIEEFHQIKLLKQPIQTTYYMYWSIVALLVMFCAIWFGFYLAKSMTIPLMELAEGTRRVANGDLTVHLNLSAGDEIGVLVDSFNKMTHDLRLSREQLELSAEMLRQRNKEIEARRRYMEIVLKNISAGVISLDATGVILTMNTSAEKMLSLDANKIINTRFEELLPRLLLDDALEVWREIQSKAGATVERPLRLTIRGRSRSFLASLAALQDDSHRPIGAVMVFDDLTELEKAQRMAAWREVARRIAHEVKNPLTPISLSAQRLKRKYSHQIADAVFDECTRMIIDHVELIRNLVNAFSDFARFPSANLQPCDLVPILEETVALYKEGHERIRFRLEFEGDLPLPPLSLDRQQIKQAMINLVDNAISALRGRGRIEIRLFHRQAGKKVQIIVSDNGPGISDEDKSRLFEPDFSTKKAGMGLGLTIVNTIIAEHDGTIRVEDNDPRGARFCIDLPIRGQTRT
ncbi:MAG: ATP-binding protein [Desulfobacterales bacterium]|nr:ATP-binding protein [Desulfobacterales bacterium]